MSEQESDDVRQQLLALPVGETWVVGAQVLPVTPQKGQQVPSWLLLIQSRPHHYVLGFSPRSQQPTPQELLNSLVTTMFEPAQGEPHRPDVIEMGPNLPWEPVVPMLEALGVEMRPAGSLTDLHTAFQYLSIKLAGRKIPDLPIGPE